MRITLAMQVVNNLQQRNGTVPVPKGSEVLGLMWTEMSLGGTDLSWTSKIMKEANRQREGMRALEVKPHELSITEARDPTCCKTATTQIGGDCGTQKPSGNELRSDF